MGFSFQIQQRQIPKKPKQFRIWKLLPGDLVYALDLIDIDAPPHINFMALVLTVEEYERKARWPGAGSYKYKKRRITYQLLIEDGHSASGLDGWESASYNSRLATGTCVDRAGVRIFPPQKKCHK